MNLSEAKIKIVVISGATGIGKTASAIKMAVLFNGEIISSDSMQIYREMNIGTAKPTPGELAAATHHMIDIVDPDEPFDAGLFAKMAAEKIVDMSGRNCVPFIAGGTGLYIKALTQGLFRTHPADPVILTFYQNIAREKGAGFLYEKLSGCDPDAASGIHPNDEFRIIRALEYFDSTGEPISARREAHGFSDSPYHTLKIGLSMDRDTLYDRINRRVDMMISEGLKEEVAALLDKGYRPDLKSMQSIGYRHMCDYLTGKTDWDETVRLLKRDTRRYAKRQMTWFRADKDIVWVKPEDTDRMEALIREFL